MKAKHILIAATILALAILIPNTIFAANDTDKTGATSVTMKLPTNPVTWFAVFSNVIWSSVMFANSRIRTGEPFDPVNYFSAWVLGLGLGIVNLLASSVGLTVGEETRAFIVMILSIYLDKFLGHKKTTIQPNKVGS